ncbi:hypothetical protein ATCC90586_004908 [Pythium insidiosum]|nr:hypothetical protein ATCC90586_004908 [Pythium insidiosum]
MASPALAPTAAPCSCSARACASARDWTARRSVASVGVVGLGSAILLLRKGTQTHRVLGRVWMASLAATTVTSFTLLDRLATRDGGAGATWTTLLIRGVSTAALATAGAGVLAIRQDKRKNMGRHLRLMRIGFIGSAVASALAVSACLTSPKASVSSVPGQS